jgi:hypothetical protein
MSLVQIIVSIRKARVFLQSFFLKKKPKTWGTNYDHFSTKWLNDQLSSALPCKETKAVEHTRTHRIWWQVQAYQHIKPTLGMNCQAALWSCPFHKKTSQGLVANSLPLNGMVFIWWQVQEHHHHSWRLKHHNPASSEPIKSVNQYQYQKHYHESIPDKTMSRIYDVYYRTKHPGQYCD